MTAVLAGIGRAWLAGIAWAVAVVCVLAYPALDAQVARSHPAPAHTTHQYAYWQVLDCTGHCN